MVMDDDVMVVVVVVGYGRCKGGWCRKDEENELLKKMVMRKTRAMSARSATLSHQSTSAAAYPRTLTMNAI